MNVSLVLRINYLGIDSRVGFQPGIIYMRRVTIVAWDEPSFEAKVLTWDPSPCI